MIFQLFNFNLCKKGKKGFFVKKRIQIFTDGACLGNPGPGGWAALLIYNKHQREIFGGVIHTTNNRMEMQAAIEALKSLKEGCIINLYTDSSYLKNGILEWVPKWIKNGWKTSNKKSVLNQDLWLELLELLPDHSITWHWVKGHSGHKENERVDHLARAAALEIQIKETKENLKKDEDKKN